MICQWLVILWVCDQALKVIVHVMKDGEPTNEQYDGRVAFVKTVIVFIIAASGGLFDCL